MLSLGRATLQGKGYRFVPNPRLEEQLARDPEFIAGQRIAAEMTKDKAAARAPRSSLPHEHLADSGTVEWEDGHFQVRFGENLPDIRAIAVEFGTENMAAEPFLRPTAEEMGRLG